jgi:DnaJ-class molecular chaperone
MNNTFYNILEIPENANQEDIKKAYRKLSLKWHPDKNQNDPEAVSKFQKITEAYETLGDKDKRREYDMMKNNPFTKMMGMGSMGSMGPFGSHENLDPMEEILSKLFNGSLGMGMGMGMGMQDSMPFGFGMGMPETSPFGRPNIQIFRNGRPVNVAQGLQKPTPIVKNIQIEIDQVLTGSTIPVDIQRWIVENGNKVFENETLYVTIPKGIDDNEIIILKEKGNMVSEDCIGDIKLFIHINNTSSLKRNGLDLIYDKKITLKESLCGFSFELKYINGKTYTIHNNSGNIIPPGYRKIIPNMGLTRDEHSGNLIIIFEVEFPTTIKSDALEKLKDLL